MHENVWKKIMLNEGIFFIKWMYFTNCHPNIVCHLCTDVWNIAGMLFWIQNRWLRSFMMLKPIHGWTSKSLPTTSGSHNNFILQVPLIICQQILQSQWISRGCVSSVFTKIFTLCSGACLICKLMLNFANSFSSKWDD